MRVLSGKHYSNQSNGRKLHLYVDSSKKNHFNRSTLQTRRELQKENVFWSTLLYHGKHAAVR